MGNFSIPKIGDTRIQFRDFGIGKIGRDPGIAIPYKTDVIHPFIREESQNLILLDQLDNVG